MNELCAVTAASGLLPAVGEFVPAGRRRAGAETRLAGGPGRPRATAGPTRLLLDRPIQGDAAPPATDPPFKARTRLS